jgi:hypothetical protein
VLTCDACASLCSRCAPSPPPAHILDHWEALVQAIVDDPRIPGAAKDDLLDMLEALLDGRDPMARHKAAEFDVTPRQVEPAAQSSQQEAQAQAQPPQHRRPATTRR